MSERPVAAQDKTLGYVFEHVSDGFIALDTSWRFAYVDPGAEELLRAPAEDLLGRVIWDVMPDAVGTKFQDAFVHALEHQVPVLLEEYYPPLEMWASVQLVPNENGLSVYLSDVTARKAMEDALAASEGQLRAVLDNSPAIIYMKDLDGALTRVNPPFARLLGTTPEAVVGKHDADLMPDEEASRLRENDRHVIRGGEPIEFEEEVTGADGVRRTYISSKFPLKDANGRVYGTAGISTDISARKGQERALSQSEERFRRIFDEAPLGMALANERFEISRVNDRLSEMLGYPKEALIGRTFEHVSASEEEVERNRELARQLVDGEIQRYRMEKRYRRRDDSEFWAVLTGARISAEDGRISILAMIEDISAQKRAEEAMREKDLAIRLAYTDVIAAVTGGKLVLMAPDEIEDALGEPASPVWPADEYAQLSEVRHGLADALRHAGLTKDASEQYVLAACEAFTNSVKHAGRGEVRVRTTPNTIQIEVCDRGPGIDFENLPKATLVPGFSTKQSLGMGFAIMLEICDRVLLTTQPGLTIVVLEADKAR